MNQSISRKIITGMLISQLLLASALTGAIVLYSRAQLLAGFDTMLQGRAASVQAAIHDAEDTGTLLLDREKLSFPRGDLFEVWDQNNKLVWRSDNWQGAPASILASTPTTFGLKTEKATYRGIVLRQAPVFDEEDEGPATAQKVTIVYAASTRDLDRRILGIALFAAIASLLLLSFASMFAAYNVKRGLLPVRQLASEAARVSARHWFFSPPREARETRELAPLVDALELTLVGLRQAFKREREFMADAAHELKTAVAILKSSLQVLACRPRSADEYSKGLERALNGCERMEALVCDTLKLARAEHLANRGHLEDLPCIDLSDSCEQSVAELQPLAQTRSVQLEFRSEVRARVKADPADLNVVWVNLIQNAIQHSPKGATVTIEVASRNGGNRASVVVADSGTGISADQLPRIFERFHRADPSRSRTTGGFGLGLSICKAIVDAYAGQIQVVSPNGIGTRVLVSLPVLSHLDS